MRNVKKSIDDYKKIFESKGVGSFNYTDFVQLDQMSGGDKWDIMFNAVMFGFMVGYRRAKTEAKEKKANVR